MQTLQHFSQWAAAFAISGLWQGLVLAAAVGLCLHLVPRTTASLRFALWTVVFLMTAGLPFLHLSPFVHISSASGAPRTAAKAMLYLDIRWSLAIVGIWA